MKLLIDQSFVRDLQKVQDKKLRKRIADQIEILKACVSPAEIEGLKKLKGYKKEFRIRMGDYRFGLRIDGDTMILLRFLHRKELYRFFP